MTYWQNQHRDFPLKVLVLAPAALARSAVACFADLSARQNRQQQRKGAICLQAA
jgi:hypothetical protein